MYEKVVCIKDFTTNNSTHFTFHKNEVYILSDNKYGVAFPDWNEKLIGDKDNTFGFHSDSKFKKDTFPEHFMALKEYRKQKLEKINESR